MKMAYSHNFSQNIYYHYFWIPKKYSYLDLCWKLLLITLILFENALTRVKHPVLFDYYKCKSLALGLLLSTLWFIIIRPCYLFISNGVCEFRPIYDLRFLTNIKFLKFFIDKSDTLDFGSCYNLIYTPVEFSWI